MSEIYLIMAAAVMGFMIRDTANKDQYDENTALKRIGFSFMIGSIWPVLIIGQIVQSVLEIGEDKPPAQPDNQKIE